MREIYAYYKNATLIKFNTFRLNPKTDELYILYTPQSLYSVCKRCNTQNIKFKVIGMGANLVFPDSGFRGAIIVNRSDNLTFDVDSVIAESGVKLSNLIQKCYLRSLGGFERLVGIPATVGGAITNNVGAFDTSFADHIEWVKGFLTSNPDISFTFTNKECKFGYRDSIFKSGNYVITHAKINLKSLCPDVIRGNMIEGINKKKSTQPLDFPSAGSVFKRIYLKSEESEKSNIKTHQNNENVIAKIIYPAKLIDELGLKGLTVGGVQVSCKHAGFIVNIGGATAKDIETLTKIIKEKVFYATGIKLEEEIEFVT